MCRSRGDGGGGCAAAAAGAATVAGAATAVPLLLVLVVVLVLLHGSGEGAMLSAGKQTVAQLPISTFVCISDNFPFCLLPSTCCAGYPLWDSTCLS